MLVGKIYEVAIAGSNSFSDYNYFYVPCQRKSDGAIGFKQPHLTGEDSFHPLRNKSDGSIVTNISSHMGPVVDDNWDGVTYTIEPSPIPTSTWHTIYEDSSYWGTEIMKLHGDTWTLGSVPANISDKAKKLRITYKPYVSTAGTDANYIKVTLNTTYTGQNPPDGNGITVYPNSNTKRTDTFDYTQGNKIMHVIYSLEQVRSTDDWDFSWSVKANARWYQNGLASGYVGKSW